MSEQRSGVGFGQLNAESEPTGSSSANGVRPEDGAGALNGSAEKPTSPNVEANAPDDGSVFVAELVRAMQTIVDVERVRIAESTERRRQAHLDEIRARDAAEADRLRQVAADDTTAIKTWVDVETKRIQREGELRQKEVRDDLETNLATHRSTFDGAVERLETAIATYRAEVATYFSGLDRESDLIQIAQQAARHPVFPTLDPVPETVAAAAAATQQPETPSEEAGPSDTGVGTTGIATGMATDDAKEPAVVGIMDPKAAQPGSSLEAPRETSPELVPAGATTHVDQGGQSRESADGGTQGQAGSLFRTVPALRPMGSWLRRSENEDPAGGQSGEPR